MNRATRDKFASGTQADLTTGNACWQTPPAVFDKLNRDFGPFDLDLTADSSNHLCSNWIGPGSPIGEYDALTAAWRDYGCRGYSNPPYGPFVQPMLFRAREMANEGFVSVLLLPMRVTRAFKAHVLGGAAQLLFGSTRITFYENGQPRRTATGSPLPALFDSIIVVFDNSQIPQGYERQGAGSFPRVGIWNVPKHT